MKSGNARDREKLSEATNRNKVRPNKTRNKKKAEKPLYPSRQRRRIEKQQDRTQHDCQSNNDDGDDAFGDAFRDVPLDMTSHQAQRDQEFKEQTDREIEDRQRAAAAHRQAAGDGVAKEGSLLFVRHSTGGLPCNYGDNSNVGRQLYMQRFWIQNESSRHERTTRHRRQSRQLVPSMGALWVALPCKLITAATTHVVKFSTICVLK